MAKTKSKLPLKFFYSWLYNVGYNMLQIIFLLRRKDTENVAYRIAKQSLKLHLSWKQPSFLRVPKNYEQILEVNITYDVAFFLFR